MPVRGGRPSPITGPTLGPDQHAQDALSAGVDGSAATRSGLIPRKISAAPAGELGVLERPHQCLKTNLFQQSQPVGSSKQAADVLLVGAARWPSELVEQVRKVHGVHRVGRVRVPNPAQVPKRSTVAVAAALRVPAMKVSRHEVRREQGNPTRLTVHVGRRQGQSQIVLGGEVRQCVLDEHRVEGSPRRSVRMSPDRCSHSGFSRWLTASIPGDRSTSVARTCCLRCHAVLPPPDPNSSSVPGFDAPASTSARRNRSASSAWSAGSVSRSYQSANSVYNRGMPSVINSPSPREGLDREADDRLAAPPRGGASINGSGS